MPAVAAYLVEHGFAVVVQDARGKAASEGNPRAFVHEVSDGFHTLDWLAAQSWAGPAVAMIGDSYYGFTQWAAAASRHPALRAIVRRVTNTCVAQDWIYRHGVFNFQAMVIWAAETWVDSSMLDVDLDWSIRPLSDLLPFALNGRRSANLDEWSRFSPSHQYWNKATFRLNAPPYGSIPALFIGGWWDLFQRGLLADYFRSVRRGRTTQYLVMAAMDHEHQPFPPGSRPIEHVKSDFVHIGNFLPEYLDPIIGFLHRHIRHNWDSGMVPVRYQIANDKWHETVSWPPREVETIELYLTDIHQACLSPEGGGLTGRADSAGASTSWVHDPENPVPSLVDNPFEALAGFPDERLVEATNDVLTFTSDALAEPLQLGGPVELIVRCSSTGPSMHIIVKLVEVLPSGSTQRLLEGAAHISQPAFNSPTTIDLGHIAYLVREGNRIRIEVASSGFPRYMLHPGTDESPWFATRGCPNMQRLATGGPWASKLRLRTVDAPVFRSVYERRPSRRSGGAGAPRRGARGA